MGDKASFITQEGDLELNLSVSLPIEEIEALEIARTIAYPASEMILTVKKPDYLGASKWELRHGNRTISAKIEDLDSRTKCNWVERFGKDLVRCFVSKSLSGTIIKKSLDFSKFRITDG